MYGHPIRIRSPWSQLAFLLGMTGVAYVISGLLMVGVLQANHIKLMQLDKLNWDDPHLVALFKWLQAASSILIFFIPALLFALFTFTGKYFYFLGLKRPQRLNMYVLSVMCILFAFPFVFWLGGLNQQIPLPEWMTSLEGDASRQMEAFLKVRHPLDIVVNVAIVALLPAICEEIFFRGALQRIVIQLVHRPWLGIVVTGFLFSAFHMQFEGFLPRMFLGIVLGALYWFSGSLWTAVAAHFVNNAVQVLVVSYAPEYATENPAVPGYAALVSAIAVAAIIHFYVKQSNARYDRVYEPEKLTPENEFLA